MYYDPVKQFLGNVFNRKPFTRKLFYSLLDILLLRTWYIHRALKEFSRSETTGQNIRILDAGSGLGQYSWYMARKNPNWKITAIDIKKEEVASCKAFFNTHNKRNVVFIAGDLTDFIEPEVFNLILSVDVMEHIEDDERVFANFYNSLQPEGMLLISTPSDQGGSDVHAHEDTSFIEEHVRDGYGVHEMHDKLRRAGFKKIQIKYSYGKPGNIAWRLSMKYPIMMLGRSKAFFLMLPLYYLVFMPFVLILNMIDVRVNHKKGTGLIVKAWKLEPHKDQQEKPV